MSAVESTDEKHSRSGSENGDQPGKTGTVNGEKGNSDIENQIAVEQHKEGLSATDDIPDGGLVAWATVTGA